MHTNLGIDAEPQFAIPHDTLVVVCDSEHVRFLKNAGTATEPRLEELDSLAQENPRASDQVSDRPGRFNDGGRVHRSAVQETDHHELEKHRFAHRVAELLGRAAQLGAFRDLVLVAGPSVLGDLRADMHSEVTSRLRLEINKNLIGHSLKDIEGALRAAEERR